MKCGGSTDFTRSLRESSDSVDHGLANSCARRGRGKGGAAGKEERSAFFDE
jgi:hypothetical protein